MHSCEKCATTTTAAYLLILFPLLRLHSKWSFTVVWRMLAVCLIQMPGVCLCMSACGGEWNYSIAKFLHCIIFFSMCIYLLRATVYCFCMCICGGAPAVGCWLSKCMLSRWRGDVIQQTIHSRHSFSPQNHWVFVRLCF